MTQPIKEEMSADEWLASLKAIPAQELEAYITKLDIQLTTRLMQLSEQIHSGMAAWHSLGTSDTVRRLFTELERYLTGLTHGRGGGLRRLWLNLMDFFGQSGEEAGFPEDTLRQLDIAQQNAIRYQQRMNLISEDHTSALHIYATWISAMTRLVSESPAGRYRLVPDLIRRSTEFISAQQQLGQTVVLQLQNIHIMATDIQHIATMARSLSMNKDAAGQLRDQRYQSGIKRLQYYTGTDEHNPEENDSLTAR